MRFSCGRHPPVCSPPPLAHPCGVGRCDPASSSSSGPRGGGLESPCQADGGYGQGCRCRAELPAPAPASSVDSGFVQGLAPLVRARLADCLGFKLRGPVPKREVPLELLPSSPSSAASQFRDLELLPPLGAMTAALGHTSLLCVAPSALPHASATSSASRAGSFTVLQLAKSSECMSELSAMLARGPGLILEPSPARTRPMSPRASRGFPQRA